MEGVSAVTVIIVVGLGGLIFTGVCIFFIVIFWQEFKEFKDSPLLIVTPRVPVQVQSSTLVSPVNATEGVENLKEGIYSKNKQQQRKIKPQAGSGSGSSSVDSSLCSSTVTLEMSIAADEYGSSDSIIKCSNALPSPSSTNPEIESSLHPAGSNANCGCLV